MIANVVLDFEISDTIYIISVLKLPIFMILCQCNVNILYSRNIQKHKPSANIDNDSKI